MNFSAEFDNSCVDSGFLNFGILGNMSGFTSNVTEVTSMVYMGTSVGPAMFGEMATTYFTIELCQSMFFHERMTKDNK